MMEVDLAKYYRKPWMTDDQWACAELFADVVGGFHHITGKFKEYGYGVSIHVYGSSFATWDYNRLTRLVVKSHDNMVRVECIPSGPGKVGFAMCKRHTREGRMSERHPTIEDAIAMHRPIVPLD